MPPKCKLRELHEHAARRGGRCLATEYDNNKTKYLWECGNCLGQWEATWYNVNCHHSWCPRCCTSVREQVTRAAFQECCPGEQFAKNLSEIGMELDGYSPKYRIAFEHDGVQHRTRVPYFQRTEGAFEAQLVRDREKDRRCDDKMIVLIRVPDREKLPLKGIRAFVRKELGAEIDISPATVDDQTFLQQAVASSRVGYLNEARRLAIEHGGEVVSPICPTWSFPISIRCARGHVFETSYENLKRGRWCGHCSHSYKKTQDELAVLVQARGLEFLSVRSEKDSSGRSRRHLSVRCPKHDPFSITLDNFQRGQGCIKCGLMTRTQSRRQDPNDVQNQLNRVGVRLIDVYVNLQSSARFTCLKVGHQFVSSVKKMTNVGAECHGCLIDKFHPMKLISVPPILTMMDKYAWQCDVCQQKSITTIRGIKIRLGKTGYTCTNKKCSSREP